MVSDGGPAGEKLRRGREIDEGKNRAGKGSLPSCFFFFFALASYHLYLNAHYLNPILQKSTGSKMFPEGCYAAKAAEKEKNWSLLVNDNYLITFLT